MKKNIFLLVVSVIAIFFMAPNKANADTVNVYFFRSNTCSICASLEDFFEELSNDEEYKDLFVIKDFEVSSSTKNARLWSEVAEFFVYIVIVVSFYVIRDESFLAVQTSDQYTIKEKIKEVYNDEDFVDPLTDIMNDFENPSDDGLIILALLGGIILVIGVIVFIARKDTTKLEKAIVEEEKKEKELAIIAKEEKKEPAAEKVTPTAKKTTAKKTTTKESTTKKKTTSKTSSKTTTKRKTTKK